MGLGFLTESNKPYSVIGVTGPILKSTTEVTWAGRESKSPSQRAPVGDTVKRGGGGVGLCNYGGLIDPLFTDVEGVA
jgi:hypothetical protein